MPTDQLGDAAHPDQGCAVAPSTADLATARFVDGMREFYASIGRPLPEPGLPGPVGH